MSGLRRAVMWTTLLAASVLLAFDQGVGYADRTRCAPEATDCDRGLLWGLVWAGATILVWAVLVTGVEVALQRRQARRAPA